MGNWSTWKAVAAKHRARVPRGSSFAVYKDAMRAASREYHGQGESQRNPAGGIDVLRLGLLVGAVYLGSEALKALQTEPRRPDGRGPVQTLYPHDGEAALRK